MAMQETGTDNETFDFEAALDNYSNSDFGDLEEGSLTTGEIVQIDDATVLVSVKFNSEGQNPTSEFGDIAGKITVKAVFVTGTDAEGNPTTRYATPGSAVLAGPRITAGPDGVFQAKVYIYLPPKLGKFAGYMSYFGLEWDEKNQKFERFD